MSSKLIETTWNTLKAFLLLWADLLALLILAVPSTMIVGFAVRTLWEAFIGGWRLWPW